MSVCIIVIVVERNHNKGYLKQLNLNIYFLLFKQSGELSEWLKEHAWKACVRWYCTESSNLSLSAIFLSKNRQFS